MSVVAVIGSSGYLGSHLVKTLEDLGVCVVPVSGKQFTSGEYLPLIGEFKKIDSCIIAAGPSRQVLHQNYNVGGLYLEKLQSLTGEKLLVNTDLLYVSTAHITEKEFESLDNTSFHLKEYIRNRRQAELLFNSTSGNSGRRLSYVRLGNTVGLSRQFELQGYGASGWKLVANSMVREAILEHRIVINDENNLQRTFLSLNSACNELVSLALDLRNRVDASTVSYVQGVETRSLIDLANFIAGYSSYLTSKPIPVLSNFSTSVIQSGRQFSDSTITDSDDWNAIMELAQWTVRNA